MESKREKRLADLPSTNIIPKCLQNLEPGQSKARSKKLNPGLPWVAGTQVSEPSHAVSQGKRRQETDEEPRLNLNFSAL